MQARTYLVSADCFLTDINSLLPPFVAFDVVSCQFALHYSFESEEKVRGLLCNVTTRLKPGGFFVGTIPDANVLVKKLRNTPDPAALSFGNSVFRVEFERKDYFPHAGISCALAYAADDR
ncbi:P-TEFb-cap methyltransferase Pcm1 [Pelomyxa schiedti]|nr:P-TEFb-cap methyltransferase Pcm1 [Pelomyxa schiedti]